MLWVAVLLLPLLSVLLAVMDRVETRLLAPAPAHRRHASPRRRLRLIRGGASDAPAPAAPSPEVPLSGVPSSVVPVSDAAAAERVRPSEARAA
ncbi:hypothetical protein QFZ66_000744 [Streptomyces sp. B4I13]|uniref:hypothetical protein n=1 Tax=Streptomyces sp. B4I13 TaxID=3042271 RepID=UPI0027857E98|nr:hypothetical protein [Streptomyces sp. B4I13]MDQ0956866.1 hypothetical protein [Streptomyces sp. B4I13]